MKSKPYPEYKDSGVEWIGEIPEDWRIYKIKHIVRSKSDSIVDGPFGSSINVGTDYVDESEGVPIIRTINISDTQFNKENLHYLVKTKFKLLKRHAVYPGDILFSKVGTIGNVCILPKEIPEAILSTTGSCKITLGAKFYNQYVIYVLLSIKNHFNLLASSNVQPFLNMETIKNVPILLPNFSIQKTNANFLDQKTSEIDLTIEKDTRLIELLKEKRTALINHVVSKGLDPTVKMKDSGVEWIGEIPDDWEVLPLFALFKERKVKNIRNRETNVLSLSYGRIVRRNVETNFGLLPESFATYNIVEPDCIVLRLTDLQNDKKSLRTGLVKEKGIITSAYLTLEKKKNFDVDYAHYLLHAYDLVKVFYNLGGGVRQSMRFEDMKKMPILYPPINEQTEISNYIDNQTEKLENFILKTSKHIELLEEYKKSLIHHVVTGKVDVREVAV